MSEDQNLEASQIPFEEILTALKNEQQSFPARYLYRLSDLEAQELDQLNKVWPGLSAQRRLGLLEDLELLAEGNTVMEFDAIYRVALDDLDAGIRTVALRALWQSEDESLAPIFMRKLQKDASTEVRAQAAAALGRFVYLGELGRVPAGLLKEIGMVLLEVLHGQADPLIQRRALESLGYSSLPEVAEHIENAYEIGEEEWVASALFAMGRSVEDRWARLIIECLQDAHSEIIKEAARAAGELELSDARPDLFDLLQHEDSDMRLAAAWALSQIGGQGVAEALDEMIERTDDEDEIDLIENAQENLAFAQEIGEFNLLDFSPQDLEGLANPDSETGEEPDPE
jgi:HEAT repeat protein